ncbi:hypothetical protein BJ973_002044 [Actinoplanes tereljensis]|nr:hypothetical protein [Actinoplanes tereljensis]
MKAFWRKLGPPRSLGGRIRWLFLLNMAFFLITTLAWVADKAAGRSSP